jgi:hypothetical protein
MLPSVFACAFACGTKRSLQTLALILGATPFDARFVLRHPTFQKFAIEADTLGNEIDKKDE